jgi:hypothetical protein
MTSSQYQWRFTQSGNVWHNRISMIVMATYS